MGRKIGSLLVAVAAVGLVAALLLDRSASPRAPGRPPDGPGLRVSLERDGTLLVAAGTQAARRLGNLAGTPDEAAEALDWFPRGRETDETGEAAPVEIRAAGALPWRYAAWVIDALWSPQGPRREFRLGLLDEEAPAVGRLYLRREGFAVVDVGQDVVPVLVAQVLDPGLPAGRAAASPFRLRVALASSPREANPLGVALSQEYLPWRTGWTERESARRAAADALAGGEGIEAFVVWATPPLRSRVSFADVLAVMRGLRDVQDAPVLLGEMTLERPRR